MEHKFFEVLSLIICFVFSYLVCFIYHTLSNRHSPAKTNLFKALLPGTIMTLFLFIGYHLKGGWISSLYVFSFLIAVACVSNELKGLKNDVKRRDEKLDVMQKKIDQLIAENQALKKVA